MATVAVLPLRFSSPDLFGGGGGAASLGHVMQPSLAVRCDWIDVGGFLHHLFFKNKSGGGRRRFPQSFLLHLRLNLAESSCAVTHTSGHGACVQVPVQAVGPGAEAERSAQHGRPDVEHGEGAAGQHAVLRQGESGPGLQVLHVAHTDHEAGRTQPDHRESSWAFIVKGWHCCGFLISCVLLPAQNQLHTFNDVCNNESLVSDTETYVPLRQRSTWC